MSTSRQRSASGLRALYYIPFLSSVLLCTLQMGSGSSGPHGSQVGGCRGVGWRRARRAFAGAAVIPVLKRLVVLAREPPYAFVSMAAR
jgi:hypothetical protein